MSQSDMANSSQPASVDDAVSSIVPIDHLLSQRGTVPFLGWNEHADTEYPDVVNLVGDRFVDDSDDAQPFKTAIDVLPKAMKGNLWAETPFVEPDGNGGIVVDTKAIRDIHGLDIETLEEMAGIEIEQMASNAEPDPLISVDDHKDIVDPRRLALNALGYDVPFRWQIASDSYNPGDMHQFLRRKIAAAQQSGINDVFGWIRYSDWGGNAKITTIYVDYVYDVGLPKEDDWSMDGDRFALAENPIEQAFEDADNELDDEGTLTVYYGDRIGYGFDGSQTVWAYPVIFVPCVNVMVPLPHPRFKRRHVGDIMDKTNERENNRRPLLEWHEDIFNKLEVLSTKINKEIIRARMVAIDFNDLPFSVEDFYKYRGIPNDYAEPAADRTTALAQPGHAPTVWNLQLSLKLALLDHFDGAKAGDTYQDYQEIAGQLLRYPSQQIQLAVENYEMDQESGDDEDKSLVPNDQQTLAESLEDIADIPGVDIEENISHTEAQRIENRVQKRFGSLEDQ